jgi:aryl-alcohol dehydrogenase-like predicted oxidoreductase
MKKRQIGNTDLWVNEIGYGSMNLSIEPERRPSEAEAITLLQRAVDELGVELIDTADAYGGGEEEMHHGERLIAKALAGERRERVVIATKGGFIRPTGRWRPDGRPEHLRAACEGSLRALGTDRIDLYQFHLPDPNVPIEESLGALADMQREGKIRHIGVSNFSLPQLIAAREVADIVSVQNPLAFLYMNDACAELMKYCEENRITWLAYAPVGGHRNAHRLVQFKEWLDANITSTDASPYGIALAWLLHRSPAIIPIPATTNIEHLAANMRAAEIRLTDEEVAKLPHAEAWMHRYGKARADNDYPKALAALEEALGFDMNDDTTWYNISCVHALNGSSDKAFAALSRSIELGFRDVEHTRNEEDFESIRDDVRFDMLIERMGAY